MELLGAYSEIYKGTTDTGQELSAFWAPVIKMSDTAAVIPLLDVHLDRVAQFLPEEEGNRINNTYFTNNASLAYRKEFKPGWFVKVSALGTWVFMKESQEEHWGEGLYDYRDVGTSLEVRHQIKGERAETNVSAGVEVYRRKYPNFQTLISETTVTPPEVDEKDYDGYKYRIRFEQVHAKGVRFYAEPYYIDKYYLDKHLVNDDGTLDPSKKRKDYEVSMDYGMAAVTPLFDRLTLALDNNLTHSRSNIGFYDSRTTLSLADDVFTPDYYAYDSATLGPSIEYRHPVADEKAWSLKFGFSYLYRRYMDRKAQKTDGTYTPNDQRDQEREYYATLRVPISKHFSWLTKYSYSNVISNMRYEQFYRYNYESQSVKSGVSIDF